MNKAIKTTLAVAAGAVAMAGVVATPASAWGPSRPDYTIDQINAGAIPENDIIFNSITNNQIIGEEKNFVGARLSDGNQANGNVTWNGNEITVEDGKEYIIRLYVHNNNPNGYDGVAENTRVAFDIPQYAAKEVNVHGYIFTSSGTLKEYWDNVVFKSNNGKAFHLEYVNDSALLQNKGIGAGNGIKLSNDIVEKAASKHGVLIGFDALDGRIPGCYRFSSQVTIRVKAVFDNHYTVTQQVRLAGTKEWSQSVNAKVGDKVEFQFEYKNTSSAEQQFDVMVKDVLPKNLKYVPGTTRIWNSHYTGGQITPDGNLFTIGHNIQNYNPGANAYIRFTAEVVDENLTAGDNMLVNWAQAGVAGTIMQDYVTVMVKKDAPETPAQLPSTGPVAIAGGAIAAGSIVTAAGYYFASRRALR